MSNAERRVEAGRAEASRGRGVIRDVGVWDRVVGEVAAAYGELGAAMMDTVRSPITGAEGNVEFFLWLRRDAGALDEEALRSIVA